MNRAFERGLGETKYASGVCRSFAFTVPNSVLKALHRGCASKRLQALLEHDRTVMGGVVRQSRFRMSSHKEFATPLHVTAVITADFPRNSHSLGRLLQLFQDDFPVGCLDRMQPQEVQIPQLQRSRWYGQFTLSKTHDDARLERSHLHRMIDQEQPVVGDG